MDWSGNRNSVFRTLGASNHSEAEREEHDYYATYPPAVEALLSRENFNHKVWEPACGEGHICKVLEKFGYEVSATDLIDRGYGACSVDFLSDEAIDFMLNNGKFNGDIITNPPYKFAQEFVVRALELVNTNSKVAMFLKTTFLEGGKRYRELFSKYPPKEVYVFSQRIPCAKNGDFNKNEGKGKAVSYSWFVWKKGYTGKPNINWIYEGGKDE